MTATGKPKAPGPFDGRSSPARPLAASGNLFAFALDTIRALSRRPFQLREFVQRTWFIASVTILPTALVAIPFGAVIALQLGSLTRQHGAPSFTGSASVLAVLREASPIVTALLIVGAAARRSAPTWAPARSATSSTRWRCWASARSSASSSPGARRDDRRRPAQRSGQRGAGRSCGCTSSAPTARGRSTR